MAQREREALAQPQQRPIEDEKATEQHCIEGKAEKLFDDIREITNQEAVEGESV